MGGVSAIEDFRIINFGRKELIELSLRKKKSLESSLKKRLGEIEDEMNGDFCNVKTIKDSERLLRF